MNEKGPNRERGKVVIGQDDNNTQTHMGLEAIRAMREL